MGIIAGAMSGGGEGIVTAGRMLGEHASRSILQQELAAIMAARDERLSELRRGELEHADELRRAPGRAAAADIEAARTGMVDDLSGTVRPRTKSEMAEAEEGAYRKQGLVQEAMQVRTTEMQRERDNDARLDRAQDNERADRQLDISVKTFNLNAQGADLDRQIKQVALNNAQRLERLRTEFSTASPERKQQINEEVQLLTGKDNDQYLPVPLKDETGAITGYKIFDKKRGVWVDDRAGAPKPGTPGERPSLDSFDRTPKPKPKAPAPGPAAAAPARARPNPEDDVQPHERGRIAEARASTSVPPAIASASGVSVAEVRAVLGKQLHDTNDVLLLESFKDSQELTAQERSQIAAILKNNRAR